MCGIAGFIVGRRSFAPDTLLRMMAAQQHRGPDDRGMVAIRPRTSERSLSGAFATGWEDGDVGLGHLRLSIIDTSSAGRQPMSLDDGRLEVVYNGEIYNYIELREELASLGHRFVTRTDTEVLLRAYDQWGEGCLDHFNGMWSFALWDRRRNVLFCAIDQFGIKPFHYVEADGGFVFASEPKGILEAPGVPRSLNRDRATVYLLSGLDHGTEETFFRGIRRLLPGQSLTVRPGEAAVVRRWWRVAPQEPPRSDAEAVATIRELLRDAVRLRYRSDVPVGVALSGGVDSTGIACHVFDMSRSGELALPHGLRTFTARTVEERWDEGALATLTATRIAAQQFTVTPDATRLAADLTALVRAQDEPFASLSIYMQYCVMRCVRESGTTVVLSGQGADELFLGYAWHPARTFNEALANGHIGEGARVLRNSLGGGDDALEFFGYSISEAMAPVRALRYARRVAPLVRRSVVNRSSRRVLTRAFTSDARSAMVHETELVGLPGLLRYEDRNSMAFSIESRLPFLDFRLVNLAHSLPSEMRISRGWRKGLLRRAIEDVAPPEIVWKRKKIGFVAPDSEFLHVLRHAIAETFASPTRTDDLLDRQAIVKLARGADRLELPVWRALNLELWMREFGVTT